MTIYFHIQLQQLHTYDNSRAHSHYFCNLVKSSQNQYKLIQLALLEKIPDHKLMNILAWNLKRTYLIKNGQYNYQV